jgi:hypothetical protein
VKNPFAQLDIELPPSSGLVEATSLFRVYDVDDLVIKFFKNILNSILLTSGSYYLYNQP